MTKLKCLMFLLVPPDLNICHAAYELLLWVRCFCCLTFFVVVKNVVTADSFSSKCWSAFINAVGEDEGTGFWMQWAWSAKDSLFNIHKLMLLLEAAMFSVAIFESRWWSFVCFSEQLWLYIRKLLHIHDSKQYTQAVEMWFIFGLGIRAQWFYVLSLELLIWHLMQLH